MFLFSHISPYFWLLFSLAVAIAVLRELRRSPEEPPLWPPGSSAGRRNRLRRSRW